MYWYTWAIMGGVVVAVTAFGVVSAFLSGMQRGWRALIEQFPMERGPEVDALTGRSTMMVFAPGEEMPRYGCLSFFMPWTWKFPQSVRFASDAEALHIMQDGGRLAPSGGARIPFSELRLEGESEIRLAYTLWGGSFGNVAILRAGSCRLTVPSKQFAAEIELLRSLGQVEAAEEERAVPGEAVDRPGAERGWEEAGYGRPGDGAAGGSAGGAAGGGRDSSPPSWDDFRTPR